MNPFMTQRPPTNAMGTGMPTAVPPQVLNRTARPFQFHQFPPAPTGGGWQGVSPAFIQALRMRNGPTPRGTPIYRARGGLAQAAEVARRGGRGPDRNLVHLSDREMDLLEHTWGSPDHNPKTGLPEYGFFDSLLSGIGDLASAIPVVGQVIGPLVGAASAFLGPGANYGQTAGVRDQTTGQYTMYQPGGGGSVGSGTSMFSRPGAISDIGTGILGFLGNLAASREREKQQKRLLAQQKQQYEDYVGPHVDYHFGNPTAETIGLTPSQNTALAGFSPEEQLTQTRPLPYAGGGAVGDYTAGGRTAGPGGGQDDKVPAYLSPDEFVLPADVVSHLGDGSSTAGARRLDALVDQVRRRRTGNTRFPPKGGGVLTHFARRAA